MGLLIGNLAHIAVGAVMGLFGATSVFRRLLDGSLPVTVLAGILLSGAVIVSAILSQDLSVALLLGIKLIILVFVFYWALYAPLALGALLVLSACILFVVSLFQQGYSKLTFVPLAELSLLVPILVFGYGKRLGRLEATSINVFFGLLILAQGMILDSRGFVLSGALIAMLACLPSRLLMFTVRRLWLLPVIYVFALGGIGFLFVTDAIDWLQPTLSNLERSVMLGVLLQNFADHPFGINQGAYTESVNAALEILGLQRHATDNVDPHNFVASIYVYSGWIGAGVLVVILRRAAHRIGDFDVNKLRVVLVPLVSVLMTASLSPPSSWERLQVTVVFGVILALLQFERSREKNNTVLSIIRTIHGPGQYNVELHNKDIG